MPALVTKRLSDTFVHRSSGSPNVDDGFVRKPSLAFVFKVKVGGEQIDEQEGDCFATDDSAPYASRQIHACAGFRH
jgi:hypothetical protein